MEYVKMQIMYPDAYGVIAHSNDDMITLAGFFGSDVRCSRALSWIEWILDESNNSDHTSSNSHYFEKEGTYLYISFLYDSRRKKTRVKISCQNIVQLLLVWREKVCEASPKYIIIFNKDGIFTMETYDEEPKIVEK
jgi:hypothetical protein